MTKAGIIRVVNNRNCSYVQNLHTPVTHYQKTENSQIHEGWKNGEHLQKFRRRVFPLFFFIFAFLLFFQTPPYVLLPLWRLGALSQASVKNVLFSLISVFHFLTRLRLMRLMPRTHTYTRMPAASKLPDLIHKTLTFSVLLPPFCYQTRLHFDNRIRILETLSRINSECQVCIRNHKQTKPSFWQQNRGKMVEAGVSRLNHNVSLHSWWARIFTLGLNLYFTW